MPKDDDEGRSGRGGCGGGGGGDGGTPGETPGGTLSEKLLKKKWMKLLKN